MSNKNRKNFLIDYQYAVGLTLGLIMGAWMRWNIFSVIVFIWFMVLIERWFFRIK